jgi:hypothetical protein
MTHYRRLTFDPLQVSDDGHTYMLTAHDGVQPLTLQARHLQWQGPHLVGLLTLHYGEEPLVADALFAFTNFHERNALLGSLDRFIWSPALNRFCAQIAGRQSTRLQVVRLVDVPVSEDTQVTYWPIDPLPPVILDEVTVWFGDGGVGKSYLALYAAGSLAAQGFRVLYADWEMSRGRHGHRLKELFGFGLAQVPDGVFYVSCESPLVQLGQDLIHQIAKHRIDFVIVDSVARACHGDAERNEVATTYLGTARGLGVGSLHIAHVTKSTAQTADKPFGSVFWHNGARETWSVLHAPDYSRDGAVGLVMQQRKSNFAAPNTKRYTLQLLAEAGRMYLQSPEPEPVSEGQLHSAQDLMRHALAGGPLMRDELRRRCAALRPATFRKALQRERDAGTVVDLDGGLLALNEPPSA